jgi:hypothetical protein
MLLALAGQFLTWRFLDRQGWTRGNPYSLSAAPDGRGLRITVKELGDNSTRLRALRPGTPVLFEGRFGRLTARARTRRRVALIGAGVGVAPLRALAGGWSRPRGTRSCCSGSPTGPCSSASSISSPSGGGSRSCGFPATAGRPAPGSGMASAPPTT